MSRGEEVRVAALELVEHCPGACEHSCIDCLQTYRSRLYHGHLDRHRAASLLRSASGPLQASHPLPESLPKTLTTPGQAQTVIEFRFKRLLLEAGLPAPETQKRIQLAPSLNTWPDFFYPGDDEPALCIYLDGMSGHIHGNPEQASKDSCLREKLRSQGYEVLEVKSFQLVGKPAMVAAISRIAKYLVGKEKPRAVRKDTSWFERAGQPGREKRRPRACPIRWLEGRRRARRGEGSA